MKLELVCKAIAVLLLLAGQPFLTKATTLEERPTRDTSIKDSPLQRVRRTLIGTGGGGIPENPPPVPFSVAQNKIINQPSFVITFKYETNGQSSPIIKLTGPSIPSNNVYSSPAMKQTGPPVTSRPPTLRQPLTTQPPAFRAVPIVVPKVVPKLEPKSITGYPTTNSESTTLPKFPSHFRKLPKNKSKDKNVDDVDTPDTEDVAAMVEGADDLTEVDADIQPIEPFNRSAIEVEDGGTEDPEGGTDVADNLNPFNPTADILARVRTDTDVGPLTMNKIRKALKQKKEKKAKKIKAEKKPKN